MTQVVTNKTEEWAFFCYITQKHSMKSKIAFITACVMASAILFTGCDKDEEENNDITVIKGSGTITDEVDAFRQVLGGPLNNTPGATGGRREVNWDAVPDSLVGQPLPQKFFNPTDPGSPPALQRGLKYTAPGEFRVSNAQFAEVNNQASGEFASFSGSKSFANINSLAWEVDFEVPGQAIPASVKGFGVVFSDVDLDNSTSLEFFNGTRSLGKFFVPARAAGSSFSFLGVRFNNNECITKVKVTHQGKLSDGQKDISAGGPADLVVLDDFLYSEPVQ
jgi:hypothetical protein